MVPERIFSLMKWESISICLVISWNIGFEERCEVDWLSQESFMWPSSQNFNSWSKCFSEKSSQVVLVIAQYFVSVLGLATALFHEIKLPPISALLLVMDLLSPTSAILWAATGKRKFRATFLAGNHHYQTSPETINALPKFQLHLRRHALTHFFPCAFFKHPLHVAMHPATSLTNVSVPGSPHHAPWFCPHFLNWRSGWQVSLKTYMNNISTFFVLAGRIHCNPQASSTVWMYPLWNGNFLVIVWTLSRAHGNHRECNLVLGQSQIIVLAPNYHPSPAAFVEKAA